MSESETRTEASDGKSESQAPNHVFEANVQEPPPQDPQVYYSNVPAEFDRRFLRPPAHKKQFLISPPASPPVGWEPILEHEPTSMDFDLLQALSSLSPGEAHELHAPTGDQPAIVVHICEDLIGEDGKPLKSNAILKSKIQQTTRPPVAGRGRALTNS